MRVAFASSTGETIDAHFGQASRFFLWEIGPESAECVGSIEAPQGVGFEERTVARADALAGCAMVCSLQIGGPAAARLASRRVHPLKVPADERVAELVRKLQRVLQVGPPPWLRKTSSRPACAGASDTNYNRDIEE